MNRDEAKQFLLGIKKMIDQMDAERKKGITFAGSVQSVTVDGEEHRFRFYPAGEGPRPVYIDIHGGGMCWGTMEDGDPLARMMNEQLGVHVLSPDYPLVPDIEYPALPEFVYATIREIVRQTAQFGIDPDRLIVGGRSAGANLAAVMTIYAAQRKDIRFVGQILDHPWLDLCGKIGWEGRAGDQSVLSETTMKTLALGYAAPERQADMCCTPLNTPPEILKQLPPAIIQTCELDPMRFEGEAYVQLLKDAGVPVRAHCFPGALHGFSEGFDALGQAGRQWIIDAVKDLKWTE